MPELIPTGRVDFMLWFMFITSVITLGLATTNLISSGKRLREASSILDERGIIIAKAVLRAGLGGIVVAIAAMVFTGEAIKGDFNLVDNWFSYMFLFAVYVGALNCLIQGVGDHRDRVKLNRISNKGN